MEEKNKKKGRLRGERRKERKNKTRINKRGKKGELEGEGKVDKLEKRNLGIHFGAQSSSVSPCVCRKLWEHVSSRVRTGDRESS